MLSIIAGVGIGLAAEFIHYNQAGILPPRRRKYGIVQIDSLADKNDNTRQSKPRKRKAKPVYGYYSGVRHGKRGKHNDWKEI